MTTHSKPEYFFNMLEIGKKLLYIKKILSQYNIKMIKQRGIKEPQHMSKEELLNALNAFIRHNSKREVKKIRKKLLKLEQKKLLKYRIFQKMN